jgi:hypothetical protein
MATNPERIIDDRPGFIARPTGLRVVSTKEANEAHEKLPRTKANSHRATARGYAVPDDSGGAGVLIEAGEIVPADVPVSDEWMAKIKKGDQALEDAVAEAQQPLKDDPDLTQLSRPALEALATEAGVTSVRGLSKDDLIAAISAQRDNTR